ncbi:hypothetical protein ANME2D_00286 [Candidatus Methanoperedens nitroreducens]|uniref:Uncharacterized protein n=1 Tax=Candidatus Methanoperedens nitratireducens TaxID=1392998 RepID=A0A062V281_9EURY|nr:hypothetical protein [Candidatus Methanoperedens nitroreducens]KCZ73226.1 hypothetical protein ANME2D_00286 [Candidatus Methanoperedens nitroreducens]MDJ1422826.1 hypothetical protein [Candidatus Methanoperedens sp.]
MKETIKVNGYNIADMRSTDWNFYAAGRKINRMMAIRAMHIGVKVTAELKRSC